MDDLMKEGAALLSTLADGALNASDVCCRVCKSLTYGELWVGRETASALPLETELTLPQPLSNSDLFTSLKRNPQGQLCLSLNRSLVLRKAIEAVLEAGLNYGLQNSPISGAESILLLGDEDTPETVEDWLCASWNVSKGRIALVRKLLARLLRLTGHRVAEVGHDTSSHEVIQQILKCSLLEYCNPHNLIAL